MQKSKFGLFAFFFFYFSGVGLLNTFLPIYWHRSGFNFSQIGIFNTTFSIAGGVALMPICALSDRLQQRHAFVIAGAVLSGAGAILLQFSSNFQGIIAIQALSGVAMSVSMSLAGTMCADAFQSQNSGKGFGSARAGGTFGYLLVMVLLLFVSLKLRDLLSFNLSSLCFLLAAVSVQVVPRQQKVKTHASSSFHGFTQILRNRNAIAFLLFYFLMQMSFSGQMSYLTLYINGLNPAPEKWFIPLALIFSSMVELPFMALSGRYIDRLGALAPLKITCIAMVIRTLGYALFPNQTAILGLQLMHGLTFSLFTIAPFAFFATLAEERYRATSLAILGVVTTISFAITPLIAGRLADRIGIQNLFFVFSLCAFLGSIVLFAFVKQPKTAFPEL